MEERIKIAFEKVLSAIQKDRSLLRYIKSSGFENQDITIENICDISCNHLFDDYRIVWYFESRGSYY